MTPKSSKRINIDTPSNSELDEKLRRVGFTEHEVLMIERLYKPYLNNQIIEARIDERIMQGEEDSLESYRKARLTQLRTTK